MKPFTVLGIESVRDLKMINDIAIELANAIPDGLIIYDNDLLIICWNAVAERFFSQDCLCQGESVLKLFPNLHRDNFRKTQVEWLVELQSTSPPGYYLSVNHRPYTQDKNLLVIKDVTHTHKLEAMRQDFIANVSHELRTPLTVFYGYLTLLLDNLDVPQSKLKDILNQMSGQVDRMQRLVEDLLLLSRLECHEPDHQQDTEMVVQSMLHSIVNDATSLSDGQHQFFVNVDENLILVGQAEELRSAFSNLIFNALRYTPSLGKIDIRWFREGRGAVFEVKDNGIGIPKKHISRITQRFYQVDKSRTYIWIGGTGLGLAIVKHVLIRHGGELEIESESGRGSVFRCVFPETSIINK